MNTLNSSTKKFFLSSSLFWVVLIALLAGFILSIFSWLNLCVEHCSATQTWKLLGLPFGIFGILFFFGATLLHITSRFYPFLTPFVGWMIASGVGAEVMMIEIQKNQIGTWCPVCLSIATSVGVAALAFSSEYFINFYRNIQFKNKEKIMQRIQQGFTSLLFVILGFSFILFGAQKVNAAQVAMDEIKEKIAFGNKKSPIEIYYFTDWFCPACLKAEPTVEKIYPKIAGDVVLYFIDYPVHKTSLNFIPYNLAIMVNNKKDYFKGRDALHKLSLKNSEPNDEDAAQTLKKESMILKELSFVQVKNAMELADSLVKKFDLNSTPTLVILNTKNNRTIKLEGSLEISEDNILKGIDKVRQLSKK